MAAQEATPAGWPDEAQLPFERHAWSVATRSAIHAALAPLRTNGAIATVSIWGPASIEVEVPHTSLGDARTPEEVGAHARIATLDVYVRAALAPLALDPAPAITYLRHEIVRCAGRHEAPSDAGAASPAAAGAEPWPKETRQAVVRRLTPLVDAGVIAGATVRPDGVVVDVDWRVVDAAGARTEEEVAALARTNGTWEAVERALAPLDLGPLRLEWHRYELVPASGGAGGAGDAAPLPEPWSKETRGAILRALFPLVQEGVIACGMLRPGNVVQLDVDWRVADAAGARTDEEVAARARTNGAREAVERALAPLNLGALALEWGRYEMVSA
jgi:hypothetical protein